MNDLAWYCPGCKAYHAPHVVTCPNPVEAIASQPLRPSAPQQIPTTTPALTVGTVILQTKHLTAESLRAYEERVRDTRWGVPL